MNPAPFVLEGHLPDRGQAVTCPRRDAGARGLRGRRRGITCRIPATIVAPCPRRDAGPVPRRDAGPVRTPGPFLQPLSQLIPRTRVSIRVDWFLQFG